MYFIVCFLTCIVIEQIPTINLSAFTPFARCAYHGIVQTLPGIVQNKGGMERNAAVILTPCRCSMAAEALILENATTVPAGSVSNGLSVCGYETELNRLPNISFENQVYAEGFCPDAALAVGTLYPELVNIYK